MATQFGFLLFGIWFLSLAVHLDNIFRLFPATGRIRNLLLKKKRKERKVRESCDRVLPGAET